MMTATFDIDRQGNFHNDLAVAEPGAAPCASGSEAPEESQRQPAHHDAALRLLGALPPQGIDLRAAVEEFETRMILQALERTGWNKNRASRLLGLNRTTLVEMIKRKRLAPPMPLRGAVPAMERMPANDDAHAQMAADAEE
jgi:DNA-binding NtrC family response regulator